MESLFNVIAIFVGFVCAFFIFSFALVWFVRSTFRAFDELKQMYPESIYPFRYLKIILVVGLLLPVLGFVMFCIKIRNGVI